MRFLHQLPINSSNLVRVVAMNLKISNIKVSPIVAGIIVGALLFGAGSLAYFSRADGITKYPGELQPHISFTSSK